MLAKVSSVEIDKDEHEELKKFADSVFETDLDLHKEQVQNTGTIKKQISAFQFVFKSLRGQRKESYLVTKILDIAQRN